MPEKKVVYIVMRVTLEHDVKELAAKIAGKARTTQGVDLAEAAVVGQLTQNHYDAIDQANSFAPRNEDGTLAQAPD